MSSPYTIIAFIYPKADKVERVLEVVQDLIASVKTSEPDTLRYEWYKSVDNTGGHRLTVVEKYASKEAFELHGKNPKLGEAFKTMAAEGLTEKDFRVETTEMVAGFAR